MHRRVVLAAPLASFINYSTREINVKIVYYGATDAARASLRHIYDRTAPEAKGKLIQLSTDGDEVTFFDFLPLALGEIRGFKVRIHLYTAPGSAGSEASRSLLLKGADGVVFVADADASRAQATVDALAGLRRGIAKLGYGKLPLVFQFDGAGKPTAAPTAVLSRALATGDAPVVESDVAAGTGVFDALKAIARLVLLELKRGGEAAAEP